MEISKEALLDAVDGVVKQMDMDYYRSCCRKNEFPEMLWELAEKQGLIGIGVPEELGGTGGGVAETCVMIEALARSGYALQQFVILNMVRSTLLKFGTKEQIEKYVQGSLDGKMRICFAITEPDAGSNSLNMKSLATRQPDGSYRLNGSKVYISGFGDADYCLIVVRTTPAKDVTDRRHGISLFVLDTKSAGISKTPMDLATNAPDKQWSLHFDDVVIPAENIVGEEGKGVNYMFHALNPERMTVASLCVGRGDFVLGKAVEYAKIRAPFGAPIGSYQSIQHPLAYAKTQLEAAKLMRDHAMSLYDAGKDCGTEANMAKIVASEAFYKAAEIAMQAHGGSSMDYNNDVVLHFNASRLVQVAPVSNNMALNYISERVLGLPKSY